MIILELTKVVGSLKVYSTKNIISGKYFNQGFVYHVQFLKNTISTKHFLDMQQRFHKFNSSSIALLHLEMELLMFLAVLLSKLPEIHRNRHRSESAGPSQAISRRGRIDKPIVISLIYSRDKTTAIIYLQVYSKSIPTLLISSQPNQPIPSLPYNFPAFSTHSLLNL